MSMNEMLAAAIASSVADDIFGSEKQRKPRIPATPERLNELGQRYLDTHNFIPGDLVQWKEGLKDAKWPAYGEPAIVLEIAPGQRSDFEKGCCSSHEPEDIRLGICNHNEFKAFWMDSNRFEYYTEPETEASPIDDPDDSPANEPSRTIGDPIF